MYVKSLWHVIVICIAGEGESSAGVILAQILKNEHPFLRRMQSYLTSVIFILNENYKFLHKNGTLKKIYFKAKYLYSHWKKFMGLF